MRSLAEEDLRKDMQANTVDRLPDTMPDRLD